MSFEIKSGSLDFQSLGLQCTSCMDKFFWFCFVLFCFVVCPHLFQLFRRMITTEFNFFGMNLSFQLLS